MKIEDINKMLPLMEAVTLNHAREFTKEFTLYHANELILLLNRLLAKASKENAPSPYRLREKQDRFISLGNQLLDIDRRSCRLNYMLWVIKFQNRFNDIFTLMSSDRDQTEVYIPSINDKGHRILWSEEQARQFANLYPTTSNNTLATLFRITPHTAANIAKKMGIKKSITYKQECATQQLYKRSYNS